MYYWNWNTWKPNFDLSTIVSSDSLPCDPHPVIYEQITGPLVRSVALKTEGSAGPSGIILRAMNPLVGGWLNTNSVVISIGATASVHYREVVHSWEGPLWEVPL